MTTTEQDAKNAVATKKTNLYKDVLSLTNGVLSENSKISKEKMVATLHRSILGLDKQGQLRPINDLKLFLVQANQYGLNPFKKEIYATYVWDSSRGRDELVPIVSIHGLRKLARLGGVYTHTGGVEIKIDDSDKSIVSATAIVYGRYDKSLAPVEVTRYEAFYDEFVRRKKDGSVTKMWREKPRVMLIKCAEANALRQGFDISGIFIEEEISQENVIEGEEVKDNE